VSEIVVFKDKNDSVVSSPMARWEPKSESARQLWYNGTLTVRSAQPPRSPLGNRPVQLSVPDFQRRLVLDLFARSGGYSRVLGRLHSLAYFSLTLWTAAACLHRPHVISLDTPIVTCDRAYRVTSPGAALRREEKIVSTRIEGLRPIVGGRGELV
jgi:hypothetical protein